VIQLTQHLAVGFESAEVMLAAWVFSWQKSLKTAMV
jgi:hypothetical protein